MKPEKYTIRAFYVDPVLDTFRYYFLSLLEALGWWECDICGKLMSPRTIRYKQLLSGEYYCSICKEARGKKVKP